LWDISVFGFVDGSPLQYHSQSSPSKIPELVVEMPPKVWTLVNIIYNIPVQYRLLVMSVANVFWQPSRLKKNYVRQRLGKCGLLESLNFGNQLPVPTLVWYGNWYEYEHASSGDCFVAFTFAREQ
jgi:hypothetical protein